MNNINPYIFILFAAICMFFGDIFVKRCAIHGTTALVAAVLGLYFCSSVLWLPLLKSKGIVAASIIWSVVVAVVALIVGLYFGETLTNVKIAGLICGLVGVYLLNI